MRLLRLADVPLSASHEIFRYSPARALGTAVVVVCASGGFLWFGWSQGSALAYYLGTILIIGLVLMQTFVRARLRPSNWLVRASDEGLFVQFRSYLNYRFPQEHVTVVFIPYPEIRSARLIHERRTIPDSDVPPRQVDRGSELRRRLVELELAGDVAPVAQALADEAARVGADAKRHGITRTRYDHAPVRMVSASTLQLEWKVVPPPAVLLNRLARHTAIAPPVETSLDYVRLQGLSRQEQDRRLVELAETGEAFAAVSLARRLYAFNLAQARAYVDELRRGKTS